MSVATAVGIDGLLLRNAPVRHYLPGGCENGGGIGRLVGHIIDAAKDTGARHLVTDTRGPRWFLFTSPLRLVGAILIMANDRLSAPTRIHHIHIAGRGSTSRKLILTAVARTLGCTHLLHLHDYDYPQELASRSQRQRLFIGNMFRWADKVVVLGQRDRATLQSVLGVDDERIVVAPNCVADPGGRAVHAEGPLLIVFLGRLSKRKGVDELLDALAHPRMKGLSWKAVLAGDGPIDEYRRRAAELGLSDLVEMPGWLSARATKALCARAGILVLPSYAEGMAMAVIEGLAHGLPVVTTRVGAHEEVITDGQNGIFVRVGDPDDLAAGLANLIKHPELRSRLSAAARAHYLERFSMTSYMAAMQRIYTSMSRTHRLAAGAR